MNLIKKPLLTTSLTAIAALMLTACATESSHSGASEGAQPVAKSAVKLKPDQVLATVNGRAIAKSALAQFQQGQEAPEMKDRMVDELVARELVSQEFTDKNLHNDPVVQEKLENVLRMTYSQFASEHYMQSIKLTDADLRNYYEQKKPELASRQFKLKHILLDDQKAAEAAIAQLKQGEKFDKLVKKLSKDTTSKEQGGDLGWVDPNAMGPEFSQVLAGLSNGQFAPQPVRSQFGWHVILREDGRTQDAPAFESVKDRLSMALRMEKFQQHIQDLRAKASISKSTSAGK